ncbi:EF-hand [Xylariomycetidae sp. FL0641]|nr:EF-hand [Xylariomycetidae sp. FL0641]
MQAMPAGYKPSPLGYGSPARSSPFRRPDSASPTTLRQTTPKTYASTPPPKFGGNNIQTSSSRFAATVEDAPESPNRTPRRFGSAQFGGDMSSPQSLKTPTRIASGTRATAAASQTIGGSNALAQLQPAQVRIMRDGFQILDRDSDGMVNREDVTDMLTQLGLPAGPSDVSPFFPPSASSQTMTLAGFLNSLGSSLAAMSPAAELLSAFSAFDDDDSGQVDVAELRDALLHTAPEFPGERVPSAADVDKIVAGFCGRRAFTKSSLGAGAAAKKRGEVFRYQEFVSSLQGGNAGADAGAKEDEEEED